VADGQVMFILVLTLQAAEACVGLALVIQLYRRFRTLDVDAATTMKG
jgi:NADH-quinone oxidoreductase subunit K